MPGKRRYGTVGLNSPALVAAPAIGISTANATLQRLRLLFPPPKYPTGDSTDEYDDTKMREAAKDLMFSDNVQGDPTLWPEGVDQTFSGSPNVPTDVKVGGGGLPMTPYGPNVAAPGPDPNGAVNVDPADLPDLSGEPTVAKQLLPDTNGTKNPATEAGKIVTANKDGTQQLGSSNATDSYIKTTTK